MKDAQVSGRELQDAAEGQEATRVMAMTVKVDVGTFRVASDV